MRAQTSMSGIDPEGTIGMLARPALGWSLVNTILTRLGSTLVGIAMARILVPHDYGVYAVAALALNAVLSLNELGVSLAIVRWPGDPRRIAASVNTIAILGSCAFYATGFVLAPAIATALQASDATWVLRVLLLVALVDGLTSVPAAFLTRTFRQKTRAFIDLGSLTTASAVSLAMAVGGFGAWSLAIGQLVGTCVSSAAILLTTRPYPGLEVKQSLWLELVRFGGPLALASALAFLMFNVDYVVVGNRLGSEQLGIYFLAFSLASVPVMVISHAIRRVAMPAYARLADDRDRLAKAVLGNLRILLNVTVPACAALGLLAVPLVDVLYGSKWSAAAAVLTPLAALAVIRIVSELLYDLHVAMGWTTRVFVIQLVWLVALVPSLVTGAAYDGIRGVAVAQSLVGLLIGLPLYLVALRRIGIRPVAAAEAAVPALIAGGAVALIVLGLRYADLAPIVLLALAAPASAIAVAFPHRRALQAVLTSHRHEATVS